MPRPFPAKSKQLPSLEFPLLECWNPISKTASILAMVNGKRVFCQIPMDVLVKKCKATRENPMLAVAENRTVLRDAARLLIESSRYEADGSILINSQALDSSAK